VRRDDLSRITQEEETFRGQKKLVTISSDEPLVFVVDEDTSTRGDVSTLVDTMHLECKTYGSPQEFLDAYDDSRPGCLVLEVRLPGMGGLQVQQSLSYAGSTLPVIFLTAHADVTVAVRAMRAGALHFLEKPFSEHELWDVIWEGILLSRKRQREAVEQNKLQERLANLTAKDEEVLEMLAEGKTNRAIASELHVCLRTVDARRRNVMNKLAVETRPELLRVAFALMDSKRRHEEPNGLPVPRVLPR